MPKNLMPVAAVCGNPLSGSQGHGSMLVTQEIGVSQFELEARRVGRHVGPRLEDPQDGGRRPDNLSPSPHSRGWPGRGRSGGRKVIDPHPGLPLFNLIAMNL
jgi:hypothetical protein